MMKKTTDNEKISTQSNLETKSTQSLRLKKKNERTFKLRLCPECKSDKVGVVLVGEAGKGKGEWECKRCKWNGKDIDEKELSEEELMKYLDENGEEVA